jgi:enterochelin esterase-like enzyme
LLALCQVALAPRSADGLCLIAPYPGSRLTLNAIESAGGLASWSPSEAQLQDPEFRAWQWLKRPPAHFPVFVGYGREDRFAASMEQLAQCFAPEARCTVDGGHDWPAWRQLWSQFLERGHFPARRA